MTRFEQFQQNVQTWAAERGIYEHSTALAQALKAVSGVGELCDAVIKGDRAALIDAIGDVAVCLVNVAHLSEDIGGFERVAWQDEAQVLPAYLAFNVGYLAADLGEDGSFRDDRYNLAMGLLASIAENAGLDFDDCCESAWNEIKDRKGRMVAGGAFVKEGE